MKLKVTLSCWYAPKSILLCEGKRHLGFCPSYFNFHIVLNVGKILLVSSYYYIPIFASPVRIPFSTSFCYHYVCGAHKDRKSQRALIFNLFSNHSSPSITLPPRHRSGSKIKSQRALIFLITLSLNYFLSLRHRSSSKILAFSCTIFIKSV